MRPFLIVATLLLAILAAGYLFNYRFSNNRSEVDVVSKVCTGMKDNYRPSSRVNFVTNVDRVELLYWVRYVCYPMYIDKSIKSDTTLFFYTANTSVDSIASKIKGKKCLWTNTTSDYKLYLVK